MVNFIAFGGDCLVVIVLDLCGSVTMLSDVTLGLA